ncbi:MAG: OmpA family protein [Dysgonamonadaceae bacterium]|jgi:outer membrane protein OmpA-like peptidoglycan-associated protein|nr:OmpA family protein [Dysgonamonadaceae bacterium]
MKKILKIAIGLLLAGSVSAQDLDQPRNEIGISAAGGLSTLQYDLSAGKHKNGFGGQAGVSYTFFFSPNWGIGTGAEIALYQAKTKLLNFTDSYNVLGATVADNYTYSFVINEYSEALQAFYINIPLMLQYQTNGKHKFFAALGGKIGFPIQASAETGDYSVSTQGYFPAEGRTYDDLPQFGFGTYNYAGKKTDLDFNLNLMASAELGVKWKIGSRNALYTGIYADYGFNNLQKTNDKTFVQSAQSAENPQMSPMVEAQFTDKITPLAVGLKIRFAFGTGKNFQKQARIVEEVVVVEDVVEILPPPVVVAEENITAAEAARLATQKAAQEEATRKQATNNIQQPIENYALSATELTATQKQELDKKIVILQQYPEMEAFIYGHTCNIGSNAINEKIGLQRAENAKAYMISKGIAESRIIGIGSKRDTEPLVPNTSEENRRKNRRVEIIVQ